MTSITTEPPTLRSIPSFGVASSSAAGNASLRRSYSCYNCNYSFHITPTANTSSPSPSSFRCPRCHHRHLIPHHTISPPPPSPSPSPSPPSSSILPAPNFDSPPSISSFDDQTSDDSDSYDNDYDDSFNSNPFFTVPNLHPATPALKSFVDSLPVKKFPPNSTPSAQSCSICMNDFEVNSDASETVNELPCKHYFHMDCIVEWLRRSNTCPLCRHEFPFEEKGVDLILHRMLLEAGYTTFYLIDSVTVSEPPVGRASGGGSLHSNAAVPASDRRGLSAYGGELSGRELDAMRDEDGDTLMIDV